MRLQQHCSLFSDWEGTFSVKSPTGENDCGMIIISDETGERNRCRLGVLSVKSAEHLQVLGARPRVSRMLWFYLLISYRREDLRSYHVNIGQHNRDLLRRTWFYLQMNIQSSSC